MQKQDFVGAWALQSWSGTRSDGTVIQPYGDAPEGYIIYSSSGHMSAQIQGNGGEGVTGEGLFLAYGGPFSVEGETVIHHVELANWARMVGSDQVREATFSDDQLILSATADGVTHTITWRRA
ncbi:MAG: lipocalin-like domain-containing protein [Gammaproteobacteria bacterium]